MYGKLKETLGQVEKEQSTRGNVLFYLATSPEFFPVVVQQLGAAELTKQDAQTWKRVVIEKPFGHDLPSAIALNHAVGEVLEEKQVYRIDHYLGKETVQNILAFRFANGIFEPVWNRRYVDHVQVTVAEELGVELRGGYYETAGALRDMVPNHIFQLITLCAMEPPISFDADTVHDEQTKILRALQPFSPEKVLDHAVRGQYGEGVIDGKRVPAYRNEPHVARDSQTPTFVAMALHIDNWRWAGVPFYLRTGKRMAARATQIVIRFRRPPLVLFRKTSIDRITPNELVINIQPEEGISLSFEAKIPGPVVRLGAVNMDFQYSDYFGTTPSTGYETLIYDCMMGDPDIVSACRYGGGVLGGRAADSRCVEGSAAARFSQLCCGRLGTCASRRTTAARRARMERSDSRQQPASNGPQRMHQRPLLPANPKTSCRTANFPNVCRSG